MADPQFGSYELRTISFLVGPARTPLRGKQAGEFLNIAPAGDEGVVVQGADGDAMLVTQRLNAYTITLTLLPTSSTITVIGALRATGGVFPVFYKNGTSEFSGFAVVQNRGNETGDSGGGSRTITLAVVKTTDVMAAQGQLLGAA